MFLGSMKNVHQNAKGLDPAIRRALAYLNRVDFREKPDGTYDIAEGESYAIVQRYMTRPIAACLPEAHHQYVDIQYVVEGEEYLGWCPMSPDLKPRAPYDAKRDIIFYDALVPESNVVLTAGSFAVLYPSDIHRPQAAVEAPAPVLKVVVKIAVENLELQ